MPSAAELLGPEGPLSRGLPAYEARPAQLEMARAVEKALANDGVLICEAGTGTGKSLAYLVPALLSGRKVIVSTATRALQEQIFWKDLPLIERALGVPVRAALMKGISNYLCRRRFAEFRSSEESLRPRHARSLTLVDEWLKETESGDLAELAGVREDDPLRRELNSSSETRLGASCAYFNECFVTRMRREAESAQLVVVNHHLFFADLALRGPHPARVLPDYDAVIFDEAHQLEDIATDFFGLRVSRARLERLLGDAERAMGGGSASDPLFATAQQSPTLANARIAAEALWTELRRTAPAEDARLTLERDAWKGPLEERYHALDTALEGVAAAASTAVGRASAISPGSKRTPAAALDALRAIESRAELVREDLAAIVGGAPGRITWFDSGARSASLSSTPVDLSHVFRARIFESVPAVVLTSATLSIAPSKSNPDASPFAFFRSRVGLSGDALPVTELVLDSPFDFARNALLYTPKDLPPPGHPAFTATAGERIAQLIEITHGGCFVLTTSLRSMSALHAMLAKRLPGRRMFVQGAAPKAALISAFRAAGDAVLVATMSFWEGVDVPGRALRLVVLEKIPFLVPSDPVVQARSHELERAGENPFLRLHVPAAAITLKQGFGRLIRTRDDAGIVALLDPRVHQKGYGPRLLAALPPAARSSELAEVRSFWERVPALV
ncbi:MAG TPA: ATP-dependent DNA helicase [Polyangiaceae bacterium]|nr:ATP-dependent DNA helicase [Polyangiaceae bacterium]